MDYLLSDLRQTVRALNHNRGFSLPAVVILGVAFGLNATLLTFVGERLLNGPTGVGSPEHLFRITGATVRRPHDYRVLAAGAMSFELAGYSGVRGTPFRVGSTDALADVQFVTPNFFEVLGVRSILGGAFRSGDGAVNPSAVVGERFWRQHLTGDPEILGRTVWLSDRPYVVKGVASAFSMGPDSEKVDIWLPSLVAPVSTDGFWYGGGFRLVGRLNTGFALTQADGELSSRFAGLERRVLGGQGDFALAPLVDSVSKRLAQLDSAVVLLVGGACAFLLIACANVSSLMVNRALQRSREMQVRYQLGASRRRLVWHVAIEAIVINLLAAVTGVLIAVWLTPLLAALIQQPLPGRWVHSDVARAFSGLTRPGSDSVGRWALAVVPILLCGSTLLSGLWPAFLVSRSLGSSARSQRARAQGRARALSVVFQVGACTSLVLSAALFLRSYSKATQVDFGIRDDGVLVAEVAAGSSEPRIPDGIEGTLRSLPDVVDVAASSTPPIGRQGKLHMALEILGYKWPWSGPLAQRRARAFVEPITPEYFELLGIQLREGRRFAPTDSKDSPPVVIVDEMIAREVFRGDAALGRCVMFAADAAAPGRMFPKVCRTIVGVVSSVRAQLFHRPGVDDEAFDPAFYVPVAQWGGARTLLVKISGPLDRVASPLKVALQRASPALAYVQLVPLSSYREQEAHGWRVGSTVLGILAAVSLCLSLLGVYAMLSVVVRQRSKEIGVRLALGASRSTIVAMVLDAGMRPVLWGLGLGLALAFSLTRFVSSYLFGVVPMDWPTILTVATLLLVTCTLACAVPSISAGTLDPALLLRRDETFGT
jgi:predicted permease